MYFLKVASVFALLVWVGVCAAPANEAASALAPAPAGLDDMETAASAYKGYNNGYNKGHNKGHNKGYDKGYKGYKGYKGHHG